MLELQAKIAGLTKEQHAQGVIVNVSEAIQALKDNNHQPVVEDNSQSTGNDNVTQDITTG
jgi:hypothetical protein